MSASTSPLHERAVEVDKVLGELWAASASVRSKLADNRFDLARACGVKPAWYGRVKTLDFTAAELVAMAKKKAATEPPNAYSPVNFAPATYFLAERAEMEEHLARLAAAAAPGEAEYAASPWTRFFLVAGGHIHSSLSCSTCFPTTRFSWLPELSGLTEKDAVDAYGTRLCSVCFPSAPVEWTLGIAKPADPDECPGSGTYDHDSSGLMYCSPRAKCNHCGRTTSATSTGKLRKHKKSPG